MSEQWISSRDAMRIDNRISQRSVTGWEMVGSSYQNGQKRHGYVRLLLSGGGWLWYTEHTKLDDAFTDAADRGFDTADALAKLDQWVKTGK